VIVLNSKKLFYLKELKTNKSVSDNKITRLAIIGILILTIGLAHWITPTAPHYLHTFHVIFSKLFVLPIVLSAIWFEITGAVLSALIISIIYIPHVFLQWGGPFPENVNQLGEVVTIWVVSILSGIFSGIEKGALRKVAETHEGSLIAMIAALDAREHNTELHSLRVREYALRIGLESGLDKHQMQILGQGALLHDIGKIGIPDDILLKEDPLDNQQRQVMQQHPQIGRKVLLTIPFLKETAEVVYCHHERYDGKGYPRGLRGDQIPLESRIFMAADVFDALTSDRPYRKKLDYEQAKKEITKESGSHFDPKVVNAFLRISATEWKKISKQVSERAAYIIKPRL
jgi:putative nucleotidyltransferase with HDIG domain